MSISQRRVTSAAEMQALAHPLRLRLLELLSSEGAFTSSQAARRLDETPANVSWHLRKLARHGFVRQGQGPGRERPWKYVAQSFTFGADAEDRAAATALSDLLYDREFDILRQRMRELPAEDEQWRDAASIVQSRLWLTPEEARELGRSIVDLVAAAGLAERNQDATRRPPGARLMAAMGWVVPFGPVPAAAATAATAEGQPEAGQVACR